jgi:DNA polymerase III subunit epsilon
MNFCNQCGAKIRSDSRFCSNCGCDLQTSSTIFLDTETTGLSGSTDKIIELAIVDSSGRTLFNELIDPERPIKNSHIHGITDSMVSGQPTLDQCWEVVKSILKDKHIVIYNKAFDTKFFPDGLSCAKKVSCAMQRFKNFHQGKKYNLQYATQHIGYRWEGIAHRALADTLASRAVWLWLDQKEKNPHDPPNQPRVTPKSESVQPQQKKISSTPEHKKVQERVKPKISRFFKIAQSPFWWGVVLLFFNLLGVLINVSESGGSENISSKLVEARTDKVVGLGLLGGLVGLVFGLFYYWKIDTGFFNRLAWGTLGSIYLAVMYGMAGISAGLAFGGGAIGTGMGWGLGWWLASSAYKIKENIQKEIYEEKESFSLIDLIGEAVGIIVIGLIIALILFGVFSNQ